MIVINDIFNNKYLFSCTMTSFLYITHWTLKTDIEDKEDYILTLKLAN